MPDFCTPRRGFRHDLNSAVASLRRLGVEDDRIVVACAGPGWPRGTVLRQHPAPGEPLTARVRVTLAAAGAGGFDLLPYALRDGVEGEFGADRLMALFDNPLEKLALHLRQAGGFLALHPDDETVTLRWIEEIFGLRAAPFPRDAWYPLARLLPALHRIAGTPGAVEVAFGIVFGLPVSGVRVLAEVVPLPPEGRTRLGERASRLGIDVVAGEGVREESVLEVTFGPLALPEWRRHAPPARRAERDALYRLVVPAAFHGSVRERWAVGDPALGARFGAGADEPVLGINARLGAVPERNAA